MVPGPRFGGRACDLIADSVHLHGENHLRVVSGSYDTPKEAVADFERLYGEAVRPGSPPPTDTEQQAAQALAALSTATAPQPRPAGLS
ncbi:hypothetical protein RB200_06775 [Streptomyces sp. PmtG]